MTGDAVAPAVRRREVGVRALRDRAGVGGHRQRDGHRRHQRHGQPSTRGGDRIGDAVYEQSSFLFQDIVYFATDDGLWKTDGTANGTTSIGIGVLDPARVVQPRPPLEYRLADHAKSQLCHGILPWSTTVLEPGPRVAGQRSLSPERAHGARARRSGRGPVQRRGRDGDHRAAGVGQAVPADLSVPEAAERRVHVRDQVLDRVQRKVGRAAPIHAAKRVDPATGLGQRDPHQIAPALAGASGERAHRKVPPGPGPCTSL